MWFRNAESYRKLTETDAEMLTTTWGYIYSGSSAKILEKTETDPLSNVTHWAYDSGGRVLTETDAELNVTTNEYDTRGNLTRTYRTVNSVLLETIHAYDGSGNLLTTCASPKLIRQKSRMK